MGSLNAKIAEDRRKGHRETLCLQQWILERIENEWNLTTSEKTSYQTEIDIPASIVWKLFTKAVRYDDFMDVALIRGDRSLVIPALSMIAVMA